MKSYFNLFLKSIYQKMITLQILKIGSMKFRLFVFSVITLATISSCGYKDMEESTGNTSQPVFPTNSNQQEQANVMPAQVLDSTQVLQPQQVIPVNSNTTAGTNGKLNPAHGAPGHRCDISVGAPLDSKPGQAVSNSQAVPNVVSPAQPTFSPQPANKVAAGMNPEHGQPGHRCDIAVGAPLNTPAPTPVLPVSPIPIIKNDSSRN